MRSLKKVFCDFSTCTDDDVEKLFAAPPKFDVVHVVHVTDRTGFKDGGVGRTWG